MDQRSGMMSATHPELEQIEISVVIPCLNEEENAAAICQAVTSELERCGVAFEILFIDNGSKDGTRKIIRELCAADPRVRAIFNTRNFGQMRSPTYAIYQAEGAAVVAMCADFQDPPHLIGPFIERWRAGAKIVLGVRRTEKATALVGALRRAGYEFLGRNADYPVIPGATGFGLFDRTVVDALADWHEPEPFFRGMVVETGYTLALIPFDRPERAGGVTKNDPAALLDFAVSSLAGSSKGLLRKPIVWSLFTGAASVGLVGLSVLAAALGRSVWPLLALAVQIGLFSVLFLFLGLIGEQVRVISERTRNVPLVIERERINFPNHRQTTAARTHIRRPVAPL
jgi:glycosyltransferase involved in cell wall biosynthesis